MIKFTEMEVEYKDHMGSDISVVDAARVSFNKESEYEADGTLSEADAKLIRYLAKHNHWTCFGHASIKFRIKAPIFVARQLVKHQVGLVWNEVSRRYVDEAPDFWYPTSWRKRPDGSIKQGSGESFTLEESVPIDGIMRDAMRGSLDAYTYMINKGMAPEMARMVLPLNAHTEWIWTGSLAAWSRVCKLRLDPHAQAETREIAEKINKEMEVLFPVAWPALMS
jgi:thymidylate synthase (FAD)